MGMNPWYKFYGELYRCLTGRPWVPGYRFENVNYFSKVDVIPSEYIEDPQLVDNEYYKRNKRAEMKPPVVIYSASENFVVCNNELMSDEKKS